MILGLTVTLKSDVGMLHMLENQDVSAFVLSNINKNFLAVNRPTFYAFKY